MQANLNAIGILITPFITLAILIKSRKKGITFKEILKAILFFIFVSFLNIMVSTHLCDTGYPIAQWLIPVLCGAIIIIAVENKKIRRISLLLLTILSITLSQHFVHLVHETQYIGNRNSRMINGISKSILKSQKELLKTAAEGNTKNYSPGWIEDSLKDLEGADGIIIKGDHEIIETHKLWHTDFTGLYGTTYKKVGIWYPGGTLREAAEKIAIKEKI